MRSFILALAIASAPFPAFAICNCACVNGNAVARCSSTADNIPICQVLCPPSVATQSISGPSVAPPGAPQRRPDPVIINQQNDELRSQGITPRDGQPLR
ncbi:hypothetical protein [Methylobacterium sp. WL120]|uniref:hypothetical protein n=1 Tax=Methylobacterium sp. WL120 TaxID=2603887 RepID=UPI0011CCCF37|nr:hypothetical protein [Methylobacterium sp. WL120]TXM70966.1 hypothetical protein FV229_00635 [Methylobacterium sp. WL120]